MLREENRDALKRNGTIIYLRERMWTICMERTKHDRNRPLLQTENGKPDCRFCSNSAIRFIAHWPMWLSIPRQSVNSLVAQLERKLQAHFQQQQTKTMQRLDLDLGVDSYPILIGSQLLARGELPLPAYQGFSGCIVSNTTVAPLYLEALAAPSGALPARVCWK